VVDGPRLPKDRRKQKLWLEVCRGEPWERGVTLYEGKKTTQSFRVIEGGKHKSQKKSWGEWRGGRTVITCVFTDTRGGAGVIAGRCGGLSESMLTLKKSPDDRGQNVPDIPGGPAQRGSLESITVSGFHPTEWAERGVSPPKNANLRPNKPNPPGKGGSAKLELFYDILIGV